jgi:hypothetical protein
MSRSRIEVLEFKEAGDSARRDPLEVGETCWGSDASFKDLGWQQDAGTRQFVLFHKTPRAKKREGLGNDKQTTHQARVSAVDDGSGNQWQKKGSSGS